MRLTHRGAASVVASTLLLSGLAACTSGGDSGSGDGGDIVIGADLDNNSPVDTAYARAIQLRVEQINASGRLGKRKMVLKTQDSRSDPTTSERNISTFADDSSVVAIIEGACQACAAAVNSDVNKKKIPMIVLSAQDDQVAPVTADNQYTFKIGPNPVDSINTMAAELTRMKTVNPALNSAAVLYSSDAYGNEANDAITGELVKAGITSTKVEPIKPTLTDVSQAVDALVESNPSTIAVLTGPEQAQAVAKEARSAGFKGTLFFDAEAASDQFIPAGATATAMKDAKMVFTQILAIDDVVATTPAKAARKQWFRDYTARYGAYSGVAAFGADATDLVADAVESAGSDRAKIRAVIETSQIDGLSGPIRLTPDSHSGLMPQALTLLVARAGRWRLAS